MKKKYSKTTSLPAYSIAEVAWNALKSEFKLDYEVSRCLIPFMKKRYYFIRLGSFQRCGNQHFNAKDQMRNFESSIWKPPRINRKLQRMFLTGINNSNYEFEQDNDDDASDEEGEVVECQVVQETQPENCILSPAKKPSSSSSRNSSPAANTTPAANSSIPIPERKTNHQTSLSSDKLKDFWKPIILAARREREFFTLLDKLKPIILDESRNIDDTVDMIGKLMIQEYEKKKQGLAESQLRGEAKKTTVPVTPPDGIFELRLPDELKNSDFPVMIQHGIDCRDVQTVHALLRELSKLNDSVSSRKLFTYDQSNGKRTSMVRVPTSTKYQWFVCNAPSWLPSILDAVCPETAEEDNQGNDDEVDRLGYGGKDAARWLLTYLGAKWPTKLAQAGG